MDSGWYLFLFVVVLCKCAEATEYTLYKDASQPITARVEDLLAWMTLEEKIGQMTQIERSVATADVMKNYYIGNTHIIHSFISNLFSSFRSIYIYTDLKLSLITETVKMQG
jgi:hypothetical protein